MAFDGAFLSQIKKEIEQQALGAKVDKVHQPSREEIVLVLRGKGTGGKLMLSARANSPRIHFTAVLPENPPAPPMFCMLLRKRLTSGKLTAIRQPGLERVLLLDFACINELGEAVTNTLAIEIMGRYSNIILIDEQGTIVDALRRVNAEMTSERLVLPGMAYQLPPAQNKKNILETSPQEILSGLDSMKNMPLAKGLLAVLQGLSPIVCREIAQQACRGQDVMTQELSPEQRERLVFFLRRAAGMIEDGGQPVMVSDLNGRPFDFSFLPISQYGTGAVTSVFPSFSELLDAFYARRDQLERMRTKSHDLLQLLANTTDKLSRKVNAQREELARCAKREELRVCADLLNANLYRLEKGMPFADLEDFYQEGSPLRRIRLDPALSPSQNAQKYYKDYRRAQTAERMLTQQIEQAGAELAYLDTVFDALSRAESERELGEIRQELAEQGYLRRSGDKRRLPAALGPLQFTTTDGFTVLVGRNNRQNDQLTLRTAGNNDIWFHTKNIPGSHTILLMQNRQPTDTALHEAAMLAAFHSKAADSAQVPVDWTQVRYVHKPQGAKPGMVIYDHYQTIYVTPDEEICRKLKKI
ncbi:MAG: NFACT RNA binding domain-containing protein [Firmicutes bacterium]|nr:NFACT RNA binding domain-containing protein [Bacillota bacterium]